MVTATTAVLVDDTPGEGEFNDDIGVLVGTSADHAGSGSGMAAGSSRLLAPAAVATIDVTDVTHDGGDSAAEPLPLAAIDTPVDAKPALAAASSSPLPPPPAYEPPSSATPGPEPQVSPAVDLTPHLTASVSLADLIALETPDTVFTISPSGLGQFIMLDCDRYLRLAAIPRARRTAARSVGD